MANYQLSKRAEQELESIYKYSFAKFGETQADQYLHGLHETFTMLAQNPGSGRRCDHIKKGYRRHEHSQHIIFYKSLESGILVTRVLGVKQNLQSQIKV